MRGGVGGGAVGVVAVIGGDVGHARGDYAGWSLGGGRGV